MRSLVEPLLGGRAPHHGFGVRGASEPRGLVRPKQVHGRRVVRGEECRHEPPPEADAVVSIEPGLPVAVVTADCVPVLLAAPDGAAVAAVHAGWRGLAQGVVEAGVAVLVEAAGAAPEQLVAGIGPHIGACCYEVDGPVLDALGARHGEALTLAAQPVRAGHAMLDLGGLVVAALVAAGVPLASVGLDSAACTHCDPERFHSYRRDGPRSGRLVHFIAATGRQG